MSSKYCLESSELPAWSGAGIEASGERKVVDRVKLGGRAFVDGLNSAHSSLRAAFLFEGSVFSVHIPYPMILIK
jgi:hypothetical protein